MVITGCELEAVLEARRPPEKSIGQLGRLIWASAMYCTVLIGLRPWDSSLE